ncbi:MAG: sulfatase-like hydrolase/transferase [Planctomycetaceae bacterium]|nr:sulfatase-like hydrolase/transferase [Planctomycetaceae bacterium]
MRPLHRIQSVWLAIISVAIPVAAADEMKKPNIVLIVADDLGYGDLGIHGGKDIPTPHIDAIAKAGVRATSGYVSGPYCSPTRAGLLTGRYQQRFGHEFNPGGGGGGDAIGLSLDEVTLPTRLKAAGYVTGMVGKWHLGNSPQFHPQQRGFDEFYGFLGGAHPYFPGGNAAAPILRGTEPVDAPAYLTDAFAVEAKGFIDRHKDRTFFLYLPFNAVHNPQHAKAEHLEQFKHIADERRRTYAGMLTAMDEAIGQVMAKLKTHGLEENTLVFFISDNGGPPVNGSTNTPLNGQKATTWEGGVRVPFFVKWPAKIKAGAVYDQPIIQLDILPTALAAAGAPATGKAPLDGVNLLPYFTGENKDVPHANLYWRFGQQIALRQGDWKLLKVAGDTQPRLYNLKDDIGEAHDLAAVQPDRVKKLQAEWDGWDKTLVAPKWTPGPQQGKKKKAARNQ